MRVGRIGVGILALACWLGASEARSEGRAPSPGRRLDAARVEAEKTAHATESGADASHRGGGERAQGEDVATAFVIPEIPFVDTGNTCAYLDDTNAVCPFHALGGKDVVYRFSPAVNCSVRVDLCASDYDTKLYVYENAVGNLIACNDDACGSDGWRSAIELLPLDAGNDYYFVVDGYYVTTCGEYVISVDEYECGSRCPSLAYSEWEPDCTDDFVDVSDGGCDSNPPRFFNFCPTAEGVTVCGTYGGFLSSGAEDRDTDWYRIVLPFSGWVEVCVEGQYPTVLGIIDGSEGCPVEGFVDSATGPECQRICLSRVLPYGEWWIFVATAGFGASAGPCPGKYTLTTVGDFCTNNDLPVESTSWGDIKALYRDR